MYKDLNDSETNLLSLKQEINTDFLYNALENLKMLAEIESNHSISDALTSLGGVLRYNLSWVDDFVTLKDELLYIQDYINIMNIRYEGCLNLKTDIESHYLRKKILKMSLYRLVEDLILNSSQMTIKLVIQTCIEDDTMYISLTRDLLNTSDKSLYIQDEKLNRSGIVRQISDYQWKGLQIINERIKTEYGTQYGAQINSISGESITIISAIPL